MIDCGRDTTSKGSSLNVNSKIMSKYRKKPVVIDAVQFTGDNQKEIIDFTDGAARRVAMSMTVHAAMTIPTLEGNMRADVGDYIIKEPFDKQRGFYPCKPDIFEMTYEEVEDYVETTADYKDSLYMSLEDMAELKRLLTFKNSIRDSLSVWKFTRLRGSSASLVCGGNELIDLVEAFDKVRKLIEEECHVETT